MYFIPRDGDDVVHAGMVGRLNDWQRRSYPLARRVGDREIAHAGLTELRPDERGVTVTQLMPLELAWLDLPSTPPADPIPAMHW